MRSALIAAACLSTGCASLVHGDTQSVEIRTNPPGATATILPTDDVVVTPAEIELPRSSAYTLLIEKPGYCREIAYLDRVLSGWFYGNLLNIPIFGLVSLVGLEEDSETRRAFRLQPDPVELDLRPAGAHCPTASPARAAL